MISEGKTLLPQADKALQLNSAAGFDQEKDLMAGAGSTDFGGSQTHVARLLNEEIERSTEMDPKDATPECLKNMADLRKRLEIIQEQVKKMIKSTMIQKNVNKDIKGALPIVEAAAMEALSYLNRTEGTLQLHPLTLGNTGSRRTPRKRQRDGEPLDEDGNTPAKKGKRQDDPKPPTVKDKGEGKGQQQPWQVAVGKKAKMKQNNGLGQSQPQPTKERVQRQRTGAILIKPGEGMTYAEILGQIKAKVKPEELRTEVKGLRKTKDGGVLVVVGKSDDGMESLKTAIQSAVGQAGTVSGRVSKPVLEIRDIDSLTTIEDVRSAIIAEAGAEDAKVHLFEPNKREQRAALVEMDQAKAMALLKKGHIRIGWINCRVRARPTATRCYRCLGYGHIKAKCTGPDRSSCCWKCGTATHKAATCPVLAGSIRCFLCQDDKTPAERTTHLPGSGACAVFRAALNASRLRR